MEPTTILTIEQENFLNAFGHPTPRKPDPPSPATLAGWMQEKPFRRRYRAACDAMARELVLIGMDLYLRKARSVFSGEQISAGEKDKLLAEKRADDVRKCAMRLLLSERTLRKKKRVKSADASGEDDLDSLTFEQAIARVLPPGADVEAAVAFFKSRLEPDAPAEPAPPEQNNLESAVV